jgi:hypothetical protein
MMVMIVTTIAQQQSVMSMNVSSGGDNRVGIILIGEAMVKVMTIISTLSSPSI